MAARRLTVTQARALISAGRVGKTVVDNPGLFLAVTGPGKAKWVFRWTKNGKTREAGLGRVDLDGKHGVSLAAARSAAEEARELVRKGLDPIEARRQQPQEAAPTFRQVAEEFLEDRVAANRNAKHRAQWRSTLETYAFPHLGDLPVSEVSTDDVLAVLKPIWQRVPETASRVRQRIEAVLTAAKARGLRSGENPATWRGHLSGLLPPPRRTAPVTHHPALPWRQVPAFMTELRKRPATAARCLEFLILTAARTGEARGARWHEIDLDKALWTVPASRMKAGRPHRVPLAPQAVDLLRKLRAEDPEAQPGAMDPVFRGERAGKPLSDMALLMLLRRMNPPESDAPDAPPCWRDEHGAAITAHGFRSSFRDWAAEGSSFPDRLAEAALAHINKDKVESAYQRGDLLEKRREMMATWSAFLDGQRAAVVPIHTAS